MRSVRSASYSPKTVTECVTYMSLTREQEEQFNRYYNVAKRKLERLNIVDEDLLQDFAEYYIKRLAKGRSRQDLWEYTSCYNWLARAVGKRQGELVELRELGEPLYDQEEEITDYLYARDLFRLLDCLKDREKEIMQLYLLGYNYEDIGRMCGRTRERIRQIVQKSITIMRKHL